MSVNPSKCYCIEKGKIFSTEEDLFRHLRSSHGLTFVKTTTPIASDCTQTGHWFLSNPSTITLDWNIYLCRACRQHYSRRNSEFHSFRDVVDHVRRCHDVGVNMLCLSWKLNPFSDFVEGFRICNVVHQQITIGISIINWA